MAKTILITGASRGIGYELCKMASEKGHVVYAFSRNTEPLKKVAITSFSIDITDEQALQTVASQFKKEGVVLDALINNAGLLKKKPFAETTMADFEAVFKTNVWGLAAVTRCFLPFVNPGGHIVNISSMGGNQGSAKFPGLAAYSSSKAAVNVLTELLAEEYKDIGPAFNALALGAVQTEMLAAAFPDFQAPVSASEMAAYILEFAFSGQQFFNGKVLPVSSTTP